MDLVRHLRRQRDWSRETFGPGDRTQGVLDHIRRELIEIESAPYDLTEWIDVVILALDGAWRHGFEPEDIAAALAAKQAKNEARAWPDWRTADPEKAIEHIRVNPGGGCPHCGAVPYSITRSPSMWACMRSARVISGSRLPRQHRHRPQAES